MIFGAVKQELVKRLQNRFGDTLYTQSNIILSATHTHSGPGGYSHHLLYNAISLSFDPANFEVIVNGIFESIVKADKNLATGVIRIGTRELVGANKNRSPKAYRLNREAKDDGPKTDQEMTLLKLTGKDTGESQIGAISWFPVHGTSLTKANRLISGDNKGYASHLFEKDAGSDYLAKQTFVAAFAQSNEGDVAPNVFSGPGGRFKDEFKSLEASARLQYDAARDVYDNAPDFVEGGVDYRHVYVDFANTVVAAEWTDAKGEQTTCAGALGVSKLAGAEDGRGPPIMSEGVSRSRFSLPRRVVAIGARIVVLTAVKIGLWFFNKDRSRRRMGAGISVLARGHECHAEKPVLLATGSMMPEPWTPSVLPLQIALIGQLAIIATPFECTTMAGRRIRNTVKEFLKGKGISHYVIAGLANDYGGYVTTREEYARQDYEGASTEFGPGQLAATQQGPGWPCRRTARRRRGGAGPGARITLDHIRPAGRADRGEPRRGAGRQFWRGSQGREAGL